MSSKYAKDYNEVMTVGSLDSIERPQDRASVVLFYAASSPTLVFNQAAQQVAQEQGRSLSENARALALINMAISDSLVASFLNKYHYNFWRPETPSGRAIRTATLNLRRGWAFDNRVKRSLAQHCVAVNQVQADY